MNYNGKKVKHGVNKHGIEYLKNGDVYYCTFRFGGMDVTKTFTGISKFKVEKIKPLDMI